ncbi:unnamed protein product, partial [Rotaria magnacalcarata]
SNAPVVYKDPVVDDPKQRRPDITLAKFWLNWEPKVSLPLKHRNESSYWISLGFNK